VLHVCLIALAVATLFSASAEAFQMSVFRGELSCDKCQLYDNIFVEVQDSQHRVIESAPVNSTGDFEVRGLKEGTYNVTVRNARGQVLHNDMLSINRHTQGARIRMPDRPEPARPVNGSISVSRLQHEVPKSARKLYLAAQKTLHKGDMAATVEHLQKAVAIDPEYMEAYNNLGSAYMQLDQGQSALAAFRRAAELEPSSPEVHANLAIALITTKDLSEAERAARRAVALNGADTKSRFVLGLTLYTQRKYTLETVDQLGQAIEAFPSARIALAAVHAQMGRRDLARQLLTEYLQAGHEGKRKDAENLLAALGN
jgi:tetratricopeptide (TPR) repeat protein